MVRNTRLLTVKEVAAITGWTVQTIYQKRWRRQIPYVKLGGSIRFREEDIQAMLDGSLVPAL